MSRWIAAFILSLAGMGCSPAGPCEAGPSASIELGTGVDDFEEVPDPPTWELVYGAQGGVHLDVSVRARGLDANAPWRVAVTGVLDGAIRASNRETVPSPTCTGSAAEVSGLRLIFDDDVRPADLRVPLDLSAVVADGEGTTVEDIREGVIIDGV